MNVIIVGCGKVGMSLADQLCQENHAITVIDTDQSRLDDVVNSLDVQGVLGNGTSHQTLMDAEIQKADLLIAATNRDELNMLCCLLAKKTGNCKTVARIRDPNYYQDVKFIQEELGLAMVINPERAAAEDIARLLQIPSALEVDTFDKGKVNMIRFRVEEDSPLAGKNMMEINRLLAGKMLVCARERDGETVIPSGSTDLKVGDKIAVIVAMDQISTVFQKLKLQKRPIHSAMIAGGGTVAVYLTRLLQLSGIRVKIIEKSRERCDRLAELLPEAHIIYGDCTDRQLLQEEGIREAEAFVCLTGLDEENIMLSLYADMVSDAKVVTNIGHIDFDEVIETLPLGSVIDPKRITADQILRYVRALSNASGNNAETLYRICDGQVEAMEFVISDAAKNLIGVPLKEMKLKKNLLVCSINRNDRIITPTGADEFREGDVVIIVTTQKGIRGLADIVRN